MLKQLIDIRKVMASNEVDAIIVPTSDCHNSEYVAEYFKTRSFVSGFTGSAGVAAIWNDGAGLWTDGRYYAQAEKQLEGSGFELFKAADLGVLNYYEYLATILPEGSTIGINGALFNARLVKRIKERFDDVGMILNADVDYANDTWKNRPTLNLSEIYKLDDSLTGKSFNEKVSNIKKEYQEDKIDSFVVTELESLAWLFNMRAMDIDKVPVFFGYAFIGEENVLFTEKSRINRICLDYLNDNQVLIKPYEEVFNYLRNIKNSQTISIDESNANYQIFKALSENGNITLKPRRSPITNLKSLKNDAEIKCFVDSYQKDSIAHAEFYAWFFEELEQGRKYTEFDLVEKIADFRSKQEGYVCESFNAIIGYKENAAMLHYSPTKNSHSIIENNSMLLIDNGGQFQGASTDITRTFGLGEVTDLEISDFTNSLKGVIALDKAVFLEGTKASDLDILARQPLWNLGLNYRCGTGHGIGSMLSIHEGPRNFKYGLDQPKLEAGAVLTIEPGVYRDGMHGVRTENTVIVEKIFKTEYGQFYKFKNLCFVPIDINLINKELLENDEIEWINKYHQEVYNRISPYVSERAKIWLEKYCQAI